MTIAKIAVSAATYAIDKPYSYRVPPSLAETLRPGMRVLVPFGKGNRRREGLVLSLSQEAAAKGLKPVATQLDEQPVLDAQGIRLALWLRERCFCTVYAAVTSMLPTGLWYSLRDKYTLVPGLPRETAWELAGRSSGAKTVLELVYANGGEAELEQIQAAFGDKHPGPILRSLVEKGVLTLETGAKRKVGDKTEQIAVLALPPREAMDLVEKRRQSAPMRYAVTQLLCSLGSASVKELCYFTGASRSTLKSLANSGVLTLERQAVYRRVLPRTWERAQQAALNEEQREAAAGLDTLCQTGTPQAALLYGVTGSGKTQVYIELIHRTLERGRTALVLVPEIALTPRLLQLFLSQFGQQVAVLHSGLPAGERYDEWKRVRAGEAKVVLGTRSAVFAPLQNLGLLVLDEEHEGSYQSESLLRYHAREVAKFRCSQHGALLLLGSATPSIETMYAAQTGVYHQFHLRSRYNQKAMPRVHIVDMKRELREGNGSPLSSPLQTELEENLARGEQSILFLNRRGASRLVSCGECGSAPACPRCSAYLTYHAANRRLMCHHCGHSEPLPEACPQCGGKLQRVGFGTQRVQAELEARFPGVEVMRMDADTVSATQSHEVLLDKFQRSKVPILLGTQMVAKGLDFPNVTLVGVVDADLSLYADSYRAPERTFSLLTQVVGRAGRGDKPGRAVIQTWTPENDVICLASRQDYDSFYEKELQLRQLRSLPPFADLYRLNVMGPDEAAVLRVCMSLRASLETWKRDTPSLADGEILGPAPAGVVKINNRYRYHVILHTTAPRLVRPVLAQLLRLAQADPANRGISITADHNPMD